MTKYQRSLRNILANLLEMPAEEIALDQNLAEQGLDSLLGLRLTRHIKDELGIEVELESLFDYPSINELAAFLETQPSN